MRPAAQQRPAVAPCVRLVPAHQIFRLSTSASAPTAPLRQHASPASIRIRTQASAAADAGGAADKPQAATGTSTFVQAVFNVVNVMMGVGLLTLPYALKSSGWIGIGLLWLMGIICNYTGWVAAHGHAHAVL